jgi:hypothetical protein
MNKGSKTAGAKQATARVVVAASIALGASFATAAAASAKGTPSLNVPANRGTCTAVGHGAPLPIICVP